MESLTPARATCYGIAAGGPAGRPSGQKYCASGSHESTRERFHKPCHPGHKGLKVLMSLFAIRVTHLSYDLYDAQFSNRFKKRGHDGKKNGAQVVSPRKFSGLERADSGSNDFGANGALKPLSGTAHLSKSIESNTGSNSGSKKATQLDSLAISQAIARPSLSASRTTGSPGCPRRALTTPDINTCSLTAPTSTRGAASSS